MIYDFSFLQKLNAQKNKEIYAKITSLSNDEYPIEEIEGQITGGSINIDGASAVRRTCSLSMVSRKQDITQYLWTMKHKFKLEIGILNQISSAYPEIVWFPQGIFIITSFSSSLSTSGFNINLSGKDKMCLLNGEISGLFGSEMELDKEEFYDVKNNITTIHKIPIKTIIQELIHEYGKEPISNIIINDLEDTGLELQEYQYSQPLYIWREKNNITFKNGTIDQNKDVIVKNTLNGNTTYINTKISDKENIHYESLLPGLIVDTPSTIIFKDDPNEYYVTKISAGEVAGYKEIPLTYPGDLVAKSSDSITSVLDAIIKILNNFEYFYNVDGQFIFQKKKIKNTDIDFSFSNNELISSFNNNPNINNIKNDFIVWGTRSSVNGSELPIHMRYAIDEKPNIYYSPYQNIVYTTEKIQNLDSSKWTEKIRDWRELIYQMAIDYRKHNHDDDYELQIAKYNSKEYSLGHTGYEQYYVDLEGFWRQLYNPSPAEEEKENYFSDGENRYWNKDIVNNPGALNFYFDFLDGAGELNNISAHTIGNRPKIDNNSAIKSIFYREVPLIIFNDNSESQTTLKTGYRYFSIGAYENMFNISAQGESAQERINSLLQDYSYAFEQITIQTLPIFYLEPNILIHINDTDSGINGNYFINRISIQLNSNGLININATKKINEI